MNPNYFNQYQMPMYQQPNNNNNQIRLVNNFSEIAVSEIPMDGSYRLFAKSDMTEVQARAWNNNGTINILEYSLKNAPVPQQTENVAPEPQKDLFEPILGEIRALSEKVDKLMPQSRKKVENND